MTSTLTNQRRVFKACLTQTERVSNDVTHKIGPLDFSTCVVCNQLKNAHKEAYRTGPHRTHVLEVFSHTHAPSQLTPCN